MTRPSDGDPVSTRPPRSWRRACSVYADDPGWLEAVGSGSDVRDLAPSWADRVIKLEPRHAVLRASPRPDLPDTFVKVEMPRPLAGRPWLSGPPWGVVELLHGRRLTRAGVPTPEPLALIVWRKRGVIAETLLVVEWIEGQPLHLWLREHAEDPDERRRAARALGALCRRAHRAGFVHGHLSTKNVLLREGDPDEPLLIDLPRGVFRGESRWLEPEALVDLRWLRLCRSRALVDRRVTEAFLRAYLRGSDASDRRRFLRVLGSRWHHRWVRPWFYGTYKLAQRRDAARALAAVPAWHRGKVERGDDWSPWQGPSTATSPPCGPP